VKDQKADQEQLSSELTELRQRKIALAAPVEEVRRTDGVLQTAPIELEELVRARTKELELANEALRREIYERERAAEALSAEKLRFQTLAESLPVGLVMIGKGGAFDYINPKFTEMFGYTVQDVPNGGAWFRKAYPDNSYRREAISVWLEDLRSSPPGEQRPRVFSVTCKDGAIKVVHFRPVQLQTGEHVLTCEDVTDRIQAEEKLARAQALLQAAIEQTPAGILIADAPDVRIKIANPAALSIRGTSPEPLTEITAHAHPENWQMFHPDGTAFDPEDLPLSQAVLHGKVSRNVESIIRHASGEDRWILANAAPVLNSREEIIAGVVVFADITERKQWEETLRESQENYRRLYEKSRHNEELYRSLLDASPDAVVVYDIEGRAQYVNDSFTRIFGWTLDQVQDRRIPYLPDPEREATVDMIRRVLRDGVACAGFESKRYTSDGRLLEMSLSATRYHDNRGNPAGMLVVLSDITEKKRLEEQLRQAAKMEAIGQLAGGVAHDFNNLLTAIIGYAGILMQQVPEGTVQRQKLMEINRAAERAATLTRQLLAFSRKQVLELRVLNLNNMILELESMLRTLLGEDVELATLLAPDLGRVQADPGQTEQIVLNLAVNARDAMPSGGRLAIETANVFLDEEYRQSHAEVVPGPHVMFAVSDTGVGMDEQTAARMFDPFFTTKAKGLGTGLGLSTVYGIVKQHKGHVTVYSEPGRGTTFKVYLPRVDEALEKCEGTSETPALHLGHETILVVEDEEVVRNLTSELLEMLGYDVLKASDPEEALDVCRVYDRPIHLMVTDVVLPRMDGRSLYNVLCPMRPEMKVLYISGYTENFIVHHGVLDRGVHFLQKPFTMDNLAVKVRQVLDF